MKSLSEQRVVDRPRAVNRVKCARLLSPSRRRLLTAIKLKRRHRQHPMAATKQTLSPARESETKRAPFTSSRINVLLIAFPPLIRYGIEQALGELAHVHVINDAEMANVREIAGRLSLSFDVVVLYSEHDAAAAITVASRLRAALPEAKIVLLGDSVDYETVLAALQAGVSGYGYRQAIAPEDIRLAVQTVARGSAWTCPRAAPQLVTGLAARSLSNGQREDDIGLSDRELEILRLVAHGARNPEIADQLVLSKNTIKTYIRRIMEKLDARTRQEAVFKAIQRGVLLDMDWRDGKTDAGKSIPDKHLPKSNGAVLMRAADVGSLTAAVRNRR